MTRQCGVYQILNTKSNFAYIGGSENIRSRFKQHKGMLKNGRHFNPRLQWEWDRDGEKAFFFSILELCDKSFIHEREQSYISHGMNTYNLNNAVDVAPSNPVTQTPQIGNNPLSRIESRWIVEWLVNKNKLVPNGWAGIWKSTPAQVAEKFDVELKDILTAARRDQ